MGDLSNYSIETDHTVLLAFKDGRRLRVPIGQLPTYLSQPDLKRVKAAIKLRRDFIQRHMPKIFLFLVLSGLIALVGMGTRTVASLLLHQAPQPPSPDTTQIAQAQPTQSPSASPTQTPPPPPSAAATAPVQPKKFIKRRSVIVNHPKKAVTPNVTPPPSVSPTPSPSPSASPQVASGQQPNQPSPTPTPPIPNQGQVLGDSTGPSTATP